MGLLKNLCLSIANLFKRKEVSSYDILERFNLVRNTGTVMEQASMSERAKLICKILKEYGIFFEVHAETVGKIHLYNIVVPYINASSLDVVVHSAHHDVRNIDSLNVLDNTASIANILALAINLRGKRLVKRTTFVFTDGEEFGGLGAECIAKRIKLGQLGKVTGILVHELTGSGKMWVNEITTDWLSEKLCDIDEDMFVHYTPFNDVNIYTDALLPAVCLGTMPDDQIVMLNKTGMCNYWGKCHKSHDDMGFANKEDMEIYVEQLKIFSL